MNDRNKAVFLDKDGTLIYDVPYNVDPSLIRLQQGAGQSLKKLKDQNYLLIVISNQSGVAHGYFHKDDLIRVEEKIQHELAIDGVALDGFYFCPHHPQGREERYRMSCNCRKPEPGLLLKASDDLHIDLVSSWMIGDILNDVEAGNRAGCRTILINNGNETEWDQHRNVRRPAFTVSDLREAASVILQNRHA